MAKVERREFLRAGASALMLSLAGPRLGLAAEDSVATLYDAAKREGKLTYYATDNVDVTNRVLAKFSQLYPGIKVEALRLASGQMAQRFLSEYGAGNFSADVIQMADPFALDEAEKKGWLMPISAIPAAQNFPKAYLGSHRALIGIAPHTIVTNTQVIPAAERPHDWQALLDPKRKGQLILSDPRNNIEVAIWLHTMYQAYGEKYLTGLKAQQPRWVASILPGIQMLAAGDGMILAPALHQATMVMQTKGAPVIDMAPNLTSGHETFAAACSKGPHPNAARLLVNFLLTPPGQEAYCKDIAASALPNTPGALQLPPEFKRAQYKEMTEMRAQLIAMVGL